MDLTWQDETASEDEDSCLAGGWWNILKVSVAASDIPSLERGSG